MATAVATSHQGGLPPNQPPAPPATSAPVARSRAYKACENCRLHKVKCERGPLASPRGPPCDKCMSQNRLCVIPETRNKRKASAGENNAEDDEPTKGPKRTTGEQYSGHSGFHTYPTPQHILPYPQLSNTPWTQPSRLPGWGAWTLLSEDEFERLQRPTIDRTRATYVEDQHDSDRAAALLQSSEVFGGHDALHLLAEASRQSADMHSRTESTGNVQHAGPFVASQSAAGQVQGSYAVASPQEVRAHGLQELQLERHTLETRSAIDPAIATLGLNGTLHDEDQLKSAFNTWSKCRFVRAGWFKVQEGISYVDYFYQFLYPLTPITIPNFHHPSTHGKLLSEEPMLAVTILMVSSRYMTLSGPGATTRHHFIHGQMWTYLESMLRRLILGQEQFGGGFCGAGDRSASDVDPLSRKGLRTLGTVESLLLLTEWHPQALHFPPSNDTDTLLISDEGNGSLADGEAEPALVEENGQRGIGGRRMDSWLEPCWRSDRMCWTLLGIALSLAYEIGVFDEAGVDDLPQDSPSVPAEARRAYCRRRNNVKELLLIYITQTSGRLGLTSMLPKTFSDPSSLNRTPAQKFDDRMSQMVRALPQRDVSVPLNDGLSREEHIQGTVLYFWLEISSIMKTGNQQLFPSRRHTRDIIESGRYVDLLQQFQPALRAWKSEFDQCDTMPLHMRNILAIEYEYCRVYLNSLALQAVVERCTNNTPTGSGAHLPTAHDPKASQITSAGIPFSKLREWLVGDQRYIQEVVHASRSLLQVVVDGLYPGNYLKHSPVRTYFRIISVALILLKTFVLGATKDDAAFSLGLMDRAVSALRTSIVDDVHVGNRFADLLETLTNRVRSCFGRLATPGNGASRGGSRSPAQPLDSQQPPLTNETTLSAGGPQYGTNSNNFTFMPPPPSTVVDGYDNNSAQAGNDALLDDNGNFRDWFALPLDPLLNLNSADVTQTTYGPDVGGYDLLELLLNVQGAEGVEDDMGV